MISLDFEEAWPETGVCANSESAKRILIHRTGLAAIRKLPIDDDCRHAVDPIRRCLREPLSLAPALTCTTPVTERV